MSSGSTDTGSAAVLYVDDNPADRALVELLVAQAGQGDAIRSVTDAAAAIAWLDTADTSALPRLLVIDIEMPAMDGWAFLEWLRANRRFDAIGVIVYTTSIRLRDRERAAALRVESVIAKPTDLAALEGFARRLAAAAAAPMVAPTHSMA